MLRIAVYRKGGIGKSTISSNLSVALAKRRFKVIQIGYDPEADSTVQFRHGNGVTSILDTIHARGDEAGLKELVTGGSEGVFCAGAGGSTPGVGCAGRGIVTTSKALEARHAFDICQPDVVICDVLGDVVCDGFVTPTREGYTDKVFIITSRENMAVYTATSIASAAKSFEARGYASLGGIILSRRNVKREQEKVEELARDMSTVIITSLDFSPLVDETEELGQTVMETFPDNNVTASCLELSDTMLTACGGDKVEVAYA